MNRFGFSLPPAPPKQAYPNYGTGSELRLAGHYGRQSLSFAQKWGYHPEGGRSVLIGVDQPEQSPEPSTGDYVTALFGSSDRTQKFGPGGQTINGQVVPEQGCIGAAKKAISGDATSTGDSSIARLMLVETLTRSREDSRVVDVFAKWSVCMKNRGYDYATPLTVVDDPRWAETDMPTETELKTAVSDQECRKQENVVGVWYAVDYAYEQQAIEAKAEEMAEVKRRIEVQLKNAAATLAGS